MVFPPCRWDLARVLEAREARQPRPAEILYSTLLQRSIQHLKLHLYFHKGNVNFQIQFTGYILSA